MPIDRPTRRQVFTLRMRPDEWQLVVVAAAQRRLYPREYLRRVALDAARREISAAPVGEES